MHVVSFPFGTLGVSVESTSAAWTEPGPVDESSLCNIDHSPNQDDLVGAFGSGGVPRRAAIEITDDPATTVVANRSRHLVKTARGTPVSGARPSDNDVVKEAPLTWRPAPGSTAASPPNGPARTRSHQALICG
jgi:hypothetical protein